MVFQILAKIEMTRNKKRLFGPHFEMVKHIKIFFQNYDFCLFVFLVFVFVFFFV